MDISEKYAEQIELAKKRMQPKIKPKKPLSTEKQKAYNEYVERVTSEPKLFTPSKEWVLSRIKALLSKKGIHPNENQKSVLNELYLSLNGESKKGLVVCGECGVGKTELMKAAISTPFKPFNPRQPLNHAYIVNAIDLIEYYNHHGNFKKYLERDLFIDDLGTEPRAKFKTQSDKPVIGDLIEQMYSRNQFKLFISTNSNFNELGEMYGERVFSRLHGMCKFVILDGIDYRMK